MGTHFRRILQSVVFFAVVILSFCTEEPKPPLLFTVTSDSTVAARDTLQLHFSVDDAATACTWFIGYDDSWKVDSTRDATFAVWWEYPDTGAHRLIVSARSDDGRISKEDTITVVVTSRLPQLTLSGDTVSYVKDTSFLKIAVSGSGSYRKNLIWSKGDETPRIVPYDTVLAVYWSLADTGVQVVKVYGEDGDGLQLSDDSLSITVRAGRPVISGISGDTVISVNDTATLVCSAADENGTVAKYRWFTGDADDAQVIGTKDTLHIVWGPNDTGAHGIRVQVTDDDGVVSAVDSIVVTVTASPPVIDSVTAAQATAGASSTVKAAAHDVDGSVTGFLWSVATGAGTVQIKTAEPLLTRTWTPEDIGTCTVTVTAVDEDSLASLPAVCSFIVHSTVPVLRMVADTTIGSGDTLHVVRVTADTTQVVRQWYHDVNDGVWDDSGSASFDIVFGGNSRVTVITLARNSDGAVYSDTFHVTFNLPPVVTSPGFRDGDTIWTNEGVLPGTLVFPVLISDPEGDAFRVKLLWGNDSPDTIRGTDSLRVSVDSIGRYAFSLSVNDAFGNSVIRSGTVAVGLEHTLCFAGHSIDVGVGDTTYHGGFRPLVLQALRDSLGPLERIRPVGPFTTDQVYMNPADDSCFAISGSFAREMLMLMDHAYTGLTADIWVMMLGVNGSFSAIETQATIDLMNRMVTRNPYARVYVLTSQPFYPIPEVQRNYYNDHVRYAVESYNDSGYATFIVETGDSTLYDDVTGDFNDTLSFDAVHPNIFGYRRIADAIVKVMHERDPQVLGRKEE